MARETASCASLEAPATRNAAKVTEKNEAVSFTLHERLAGAGRICSKKTDRWIAVNPCVEGENYPGG